MFSHCVKEEGGEGEKGGKGKKGDYSYLCGMKRQPVIMTEEVCQIFTYKNGNLCFAES